MELVQAEFPMTSAKFLKVESENEMLKGEIEQLRKNFFIVESMLMELNTSQLKTFKD
jgi:hypothetical protein